MATYPEQHFSLARLAAGIEQVSLPGQPVPSAADWRQSYRLYTLTGRPSKAGEVALTRRSRKDRVSLEVDYSKVMADGGAHLVTGSITCRDESAVFRTPETGIGKLLFRTTRSDGVTVLIDDVCVVPAGD